MMNRISPFLTGSLVLGSLFWVSASAAHLDLLQPSPREQGRLSVFEVTNTNLKAGPCGQRDNGRTSNVNVYAPGETITIAWHEFVNHRSYYRIAFDRDGDNDFPVFEAPGIDSEGHDPREYCPVDGHVILAYELEDKQGGQYTMDVTLPDVECENCTLQVIQYMYGRGRARPYYFQCADLALRVPVESLDAGLVSVVPVDAGDGGLNTSDAEAVEDKAGLSVAASSCWEQLPQSRVPDPVQVLPPQEQDEPDPVPERDAKQELVEPELLGDKPDDGDEGVMARASGDDSGCGCRIVEGAKPSSSPSNSVLGLIFGAALWIFRRSAKS